MVNSVNMPNLPPRGGSTLGERKCRAQVDGASMNVCYACINRVSKHFYSEILGERMGRNHERANW